MESKQVLPDFLQNKTNLIPGTFSSKMSGGADQRPEPLRYGFGGESVSPGKAIFMGGRRRNKRGTKRRRQHNKKQSQRKKSRRNYSKIIRGGEVLELKSSDQYDEAIKNAFHGIQIISNGEITHTYNKEQLNDPKIANIIKNIIGTNSQVRVL